MMVVAKTIMMILVVMMVFMNKILQCADGLSTQGEISKSCLFYNTNSVCASSWLFSHCSKEFQGEGPGNGGGARVA